MTDQTVPVPIDLLKRVAGALSPWADVTSEVRALIPTPPKVGDRIDAVSAFALPVRSTFVDEEDDTYVVYGTGKVRRVTNCMYDESDQWEEYEATRIDLTFSGLTITFIPTGD